MAQGPAPGQETDTWPARADEFPNLEEATPKNSASGGGLKNLRLTTPPAAPYGGLSPKGQELSLGINSLLNPNKLPPKMVGKSQST